MLDGLPRMTLTIGALPIRRYQCSSSVSPLCALWALAINLRPFSKPNGCLFVCVCVFAIDASYRVSHHHWPLLGLTLSEVNWLAWLCGSARSSPSSGVMHRDPRVQSALAASTRAQIIDERAAVHSTSGEHIDSITASSNVPNGTLAAWAVRKSSTKSTLNWAIEHSDFLLPTEEVFSPIYTFPLSTSVLCKATMSPLSVSSAL